MKHLFVPSDIALMAKEKGFDELCFGSFNPTLNIWDPPFTSNSMLIILNDNDKVVCAAPLYQQLIGWFEEKGIEINAIKVGKENYKVTIQVYDPEKDEFNFNYTSWDSNRYIAYNWAFKEAIKLIK